MDDLNKQQVLRRAMERILAKASNISFDGKAKLLEATLEHIRGTADDALKMIKQS